MDSIKSVFWQKKSELQLWLENLHLSSLDFIRFASFFGVGFVLGLFFRRWSKYIILAVLSLSVVLAILQGFSIISINVVTIQKYTGVSNITNIQECSVALLSTMKKYMIELGCSGTGFIIGFKTG